MSLLEVRSIFHTFDFDPVLAGISFATDVNQFVCLLGPSGSGKTTLLQIIAGLLRPSSGQIFINRCDQSSIPTHKRSIGLVFQSPTALFPHLSVFGNVAFPFKHGHRKCPSGTWRDAVHRMLKRVRLDVHADNSVANLSGGEKQRVALARALVYQPALLLLDEPLSSLDNELKSDLLDLMQQLHSETNTTFIYITHDEREALSVATHIAVLDDGRLQRFGTVSEVTARPEKRRVAEIIGGWEIIKVQIDHSSDSTLIFPSHIVARINSISLTHDETAYVAIPTVNITTSRDQLQHEPNLVSLPAKVRYNRQVYSEQRLKCQLIDDQSVECVVTIGGDFKPGEDIYISFLKENIHVLNS